MKYLKLTLATLSILALSILALSFPSATFAYGFSLTQTSDADFNGGNFSSPATTAWNNTSGTGASVVLNRPPNFSVATGYQSSCALKNNGTVYCWGGNGNGQLGDNTTVAKLVPVQVKGVGGSGYLTGVASITVGDASVCAVKTDGTVFCWGRNDNGQLGDNTTVQKLTPVQVLGVGGSGNLTGVASVNMSAGGGFGDNHTCAVKTDGTLYCWGKNNKGQLGDNTTVQKLTPVQVLGVGGSGNLTGVASVSGGGDATCAAKTDGTVFCWGDNPSGQLGDNTTVQKLTPVQVLGVGGSGNLTGVAGIAMIVASSCAAKTDGTVFCWGNNSSGQLGDNTTVQKLTPVQVLGVGGSGNLTGVSSNISGGWYSFAVLKTDGTVFSWGQGTNGQMGNGTIPGSQTTPVQALGVGGSGYFTNVYYNFSKQTVCAVKTDGTVYCWGYGWDGELGNNTTPLVQTTPVQTLGVGGSGYLNLNLYYSSGTYTSAVLPAGGAANWGTVSCNRTLNSQPEITLKVRSCADIVCTGAPAWGVCNDLGSFYPSKTLSSSGCMTNLQRFIQYQVGLQSTDGSVTPTFDDITFNYDIVPDASFIGGFQFLGNVKFW